MEPELDIVIPVYNEGRNILATLRALARSVKTPARVLICYDHAEDDTLPAIRDNPDAHAGLPVDFVRNTGRGAHGAVMSGFAASTAPFVLMYPADDDYNARLLDRMVAAGTRRLRRRLRQPLHAGRRHGRLPAASRPCWCAPATFTLHHLARLPTTDASNGFRLFSRRVIDRIAVESDQGFCYSIELLVKAHRLGWRIGEVPAQWFERRHGESRFRVLRWLPAYLRWYRLRLRHHLAAAAAGHGRAEGRAKIAPGCIAWPTMAENHARAASTTVSPWMKVIAREVEFAPAAPRRRSITRSGRPITSRSSRSRRTGASRSCGSTGRRSRTSPGSCRRAWSIAARTRREGCRARAARGDRLSGARRPPPGRDLALHRPPEQPDPFVLRRGRRPRQRLRAGAGHHASSW